jgi:diacylglycerol kinase family enzyme
MVEVLNIPTIGPRIPFAVAATPGDGVLDLALAGADDRARVLAALDALARGETPAASLPSVRARRIAIRGTMRRFHCDGELCDHPARSITIVIEPGALRVLMP